MDDRFLLLGTAKGLIVYQKTSNGWVFYQEHFPGFPVSFAIQNPHNGDWWVSLDHKHWGPKLQYSRDSGKTWVSVDAPRYPAGAKIKDNIEATLRYIWVIAFGAGSETVYLGTEPGGLFVSHDYGDQFSLETALWEHPSRPESWFGGGRNHAGIHSVVVDPVNPDHYYVAVSCAGVFETEDGGKSWQVRNKGLRADYLPDPWVKVGHDPHFLISCEADRQVLWQQNHCGVFRSTDGGKQWQDVTDESGKGRYGFAIGIDHRDPLKAWVVPATSDAMRIAVDRALFVLHTSDGGKSWTEQRTGLPQQNCYDIVLRHGLDIYHNQIVIGTSGGSLYISNDSGESWESLANHLPRIFSARFAG